MAQRPTGTDGQPALWSYEELRDLRAAINAEGLELYAIENFEPGHWSDVLLDGPRRDTQIEGLKTIIRNMGRAGIPVMGYNFSLAGTGGRTQGGFARGGAESTGYIAAEAPPQDPIPHGTVWNTVYDPDAPPGDIGTVTADQLWSRLEYFLTALVPVAEEAGVRLAAHPDDPTIAHAPSDGPPGLQARVVSAPPRHRTQPFQRPGVLPRHDLGDGWQDGRVRGD